MTVVSQAECALGSALQGFVALEFEFDFEIFGSLPASRDFILKVYILSKASI